MSLLPITIYGDKILRKKVDEVREIDNETIALIADMFETMRNANGIGLAANQVGANKAIFIVDISVVEDFEDHKPMVIINPEIIESGEEETSFEEGCLSIPDVRADVSRPERVKIKYYDTDLKEQVIEAEDLLARVMQHEYDHLQGILFTDLVEDQMKSKLEKELKKIKNRKVEVDYPISDKVDYQLT